MLSYGVSALVFLALLVVGVTAWRARIAGSFLATAFAAQFAWSTILAAQAGGIQVPLGLAVGAEYLRTLAWAMLLARFLAGSSDLRLVRRAPRLIGALGGLVAIGLFASAVLGDENAGARLVREQWFWGGLMLSIVGLILVEQVARNTRATHVWNLKYVWLSVGALFTWDLCLHSITLLQGKIAPALWVARGAVNGLIGGLLAFGLTRIAGWRSTSFLSRKLVFFNATLLGAAIYVFGMAAASYFIRKYGGEWGAAGQAAFLAGAALVLLVAVLSDQFRAWLRVTVAKHVVAYRYDFRDEWQKLTRALSEAGDVPVYERIARAMASSVRCGSGGLWLLEADTEYVAVGGDLAGAAAPREPAATAFFDHMRRNEWICDLEKLRAGQRRAKEPDPPGRLLADTRIWLLVPLVCHDTLVGFVALGRPLAEMDLTWEEIDLLRAAGRQVASYLAFEQAAKRLAEAKQFEALNRVSAVLMHDLRHLIAQQALVVENAARHRGNPKFFDDAIMTVENSVRRMSRLMDELRSGALSEQAHRVNLVELCAELVQRCSSRAPAPRLLVHDRQIDVAVDRDRMLHVLEHLIRNAQDATDLSGTISVVLRHSAQRAVIEVADTGKGMDADFVRHRLFRPFDTTKGDRGMGIGAYEAREYLRRCGGSIEVESAVGKGTKFLISLPLASPLATAAAPAQRELQAS